MSTLNLHKTIADFVAFCRTHLKGDEKGEAQIFLDRFFSALGHADGTLGMGAVPEKRVVRIHMDKKTTSFADLVWPGVVVIEMKKRGEDLARHLEQLSRYWFGLAPKPQYAILCNFDEFWIYNFNIQPYAPLDKLRLTELPKRVSALNFLLPKPKEPIFNINTEKVTIEAAQIVSDLYNNLVGKNKGTKEDIIKFCMQAVVAMFAEDILLLPDNKFTELLIACKKQPDFATDILAGLFRQMNSPTPAKAGQYQGVPYFNGGLFHETVLIDLNGDSFYEVSKLLDAAQKDWREVNPAIFGALFERTMDKGLRHELGAHYTYESDIMLIVYPTIIRPWTVKIDTAETPDECYALLRELRALKILDPACGSGNFLFVAYRELKRLEKALIDKLQSIEANAKRIERFLKTERFVSVQQFFGMDISHVSVELTKVTLMIAKELQYAERNPFDTEAALPLDNLDQNILLLDALLTPDPTKPSQRIKTPWPPADIIIGNPPYQSKTKMQEEFGASYVATLHEVYQGAVPARADYCVYWFQRAHDHLPIGGRAGLVGTNTIRQNYSREGGLDYIVANDGTITEAVASKKWSGEAAVYVSIVNWTKGKDEVAPTLFFEEWRSPNEPVLIGYPQTKINSSLSPQLDVSQAYALKCNKSPKRCFQGQTHGHEGFLVPADEAMRLLKKHPEYADVLKPFLNGEELVAKLNSQPERFVIDFTTFDQPHAARYKLLFRQIEKTVLPHRREKAEKQEEANRRLRLSMESARGNQHHIRFYNEWWKLSYGRTDLLQVLQPLKRYIACARVMLRPIFEFVSTEIRPNDKIAVFAFDDDYSFGIIQSQYHWKWIVEKATTLGDTTRNYNTASIWETFPWPQSPTFEAIKAVASAVKNLRDYRTKTLRQNQQTLRELYRIMELPGKNPLRELHNQLDKAVAVAYGFGDDTADTDTMLQNLMTLNAQVADNIKLGHPTTPPGLPDYVTDKSHYISEDCISWQKQL